MTSAVPNALTKASGANDAIHHIVCAYNNLGTLSGTNANAFFELLDGTTAQCSIVFRSDGTILLTSGGPTGTALATYTGAVTASSAWFAFEFEVVINNTTGSFSVRKNGNTSNDFTSGAVLNTRVSANNYANKLTVGCSASPATGQVIDDLLWRSDPSAVPWVGDVRCYTRLPASDVTAVFSKFPATSNVYYTITIAATGGPAANIVWCYSIQAPFGGNITALNANFGAAVTGHVNMAVYDATGPATTQGLSGAVPSGGPGPGNLLGTATPITNPATGIQTFSLGTPIAVTRGQYLWIAMIADATLATAINGQTGSNYAIGANFTYAGGAFPASLTTTSSAFGPHGGFTYVGATLVPTNSGLVNDPQQDGTTTYLYDSNVNDADFYGIAALSGTPTSIICVTTRGFFEKSDAGTRSAAVQLKSGATTVASTSTALGTNWGWLYRTDFNDPATSSAWTAAGVNAVNIGPIVTV